MFKFLSPERAARFSAKHPWYIVGLWVFLIVASFAGAGMTRTNDSASDSSSFESARAQAYLDSARDDEPASENIIVSSSNETVDSPAFRAFVTSLSADIRGLAGTVTSASNYFETNDASLVSPDRKRTLIVAVLDGEPVDAKLTVVPLLGVITAADGRDDFSVSTIGNGSLKREISTVFKEDLKRSEVVGLPVALIIMVVVFGAAVAAGLPLILSILAIVVAMGITGVLSRSVPMDDTVMNMIIMIGLAVGIDYALFIVERFREERARGLAKVDAIAKAGATASRAVLFSGVTVIIALAGLLIVPSTTFHGLSLGAIAAVVGAVLAAMTLLPAALSLLGDKVNALHLPGRGKVRIEHREGGFWGRVTKAVMGHPVIAVALTSALLIAAAAPVVTLRLGSPGVSDLPQSLSSVQAYNVLSSDFSAGRLDPVDIVINGDVNSPATSEAVAKLTSMVASDDKFGQVLDLVVSPDGRIGLLQVYVDGDSLGTEAQTAVRALRGTYVPQAFAGIEAEVLVGGGTAMNIDYIDSMKHYLPIVIGFVLVLSFVLLTVVFRSIVIPVKAIIMNLLSVGAAYGLIIAVFQHGIGAELMGLQRMDSVAAFLPIFLFAILFGLSMDYHLFLLSRIQERFLATGDNRSSVAAGLQSTAHIITGAAAIMVVVFGAFALGDMVEIQQVGFGLAVAVFIDATLIRSILVPASMELLGDRNWYLPSWLQWLPRIDVEGHSSGHDVPERTRTPELELVPVPVAIPNS